MLQSAVAVRTWWMRRWRQVFAGLMRLLQGVLAGSANGALRLWNAGYEQIISEQPMDSKTERVALAVSAKLAMGAGEFNSADIATAAITAHEQWLAEHGFKIVPVEPTQEMLDEGGCGMGLSDDGITEIWREMLSAAPDENAIRRTRRGTEAMTDITQRLRENAVILRAGAGGFPTVAAECEEAADEIERLRAELEWQSMSDAPKDGAPIQAEIPGHGSDNIIAWQDGPLDSDGQPCGGWAFMSEQEPPDCWTDGICWKSNEDGVESVEPTRWKPPTNPEP